MALEGASEEDLAKREAALMAEAERHGGRVGNTTLMRALGWDDSDYWPIRDRLVNQGRLELGKGKGGSVIVVQAGSPQPSADTPALGEQPTQVPQLGPLPRLREDALYDPLALVLRDAWAKDKRYRDLVLEVTARQGKRDTGGKWTRPDITVATMTTLLYVPGKLFDVITFEVKPSDALDVTAVYEALAHRRAATRSYVWLHVPEGTLTADNEALSAITAEAKRHGIGVIAGSDPKDYNTWEELVESVRFEPDPQKLNDFIAIQFGAGNKDELLRWMR